MGREPARTIKRILVATDLSRSSERVINVAINFALAFDAALEIVHVSNWAWASESDDAGQDGPPRTSAGGNLTKSRRIDAALAAQCARARRAGLAAITTALKGSTARQILSHVRKVKVELLIVGLSSESKVEHVLRGHTGLSLAKRFGKPVLLVPVDGRPARDRSS